MRLVNFIAGRIAVYVMVLAVGMTILFFVPRFAPTDPVDAMLAKIAVQSGYMDASQVDALRASLSDTFGLDGSLLEQYGAFLRRVFVEFDFGPSLSMYPTPVMELISNALPWTFGLLFSATIIAWVLGNFVGLLAGWKPNSNAGRAMEGLAICLYPIPYYIVALILSVLFSYVWAIFPLTTTIRGAPWSWDLVRSIVWNSFLPAMAIVITTFGWWIISVKAQTQALKEEEFVRYARLKGLSDARLLGRYILPNALLPQITFLALQIGLMFNGSLITEIIFDYPGLGLLIYKAVLQGDYNLLMGTISLSIVAVATATMIIDFLYPLIDPRIRHG
ncbi:oligopeptide ABC transporter, permease protein [Oceanicola granulosus HTCC2516]|uniref:Oligopeptide ABC transporter, permease protein n=1 Tax=Oceanicola granulosus (strain ATCC BAA-861 / DSM 15982 / KCTC 12143 / HTCC2516) TaxID=314256 RepID=Q2CGU3_OCEGH|nr:ABC transporter permease [Oceanicola granulosus]EAR51842.1 oligopeptide ABC transporter, permease protein [Oceanicola granulosus HTCC2516]